MSFHVRITHPDGTQSYQTVDAAEFWVGAGEGDWAVRLALAGLRGRLARLRVRSGAVEVCAEPGLPIQAASGRVGQRFVPLLEGERLSIGDHGLEFRWDDQEPEFASYATEELGAAAADEELAQWFESSMALADRLEGVREFDELAAVSLEAVLATTAADRCFVQMDIEGEEPREWFLSRKGGSQAFGVSRSLVERVRREEGVVFVPRSASDPAVAGLSSVRREGISASLVVPLRALGRSVGVLYADCIESQRSLGPADFQKAALLGRMLAGAIGNRRLVRSVLEGDPTLPDALRSRSPACKDMIEKARLFAPTDYTILIRGETGSGKEVMARALHDISSRATRSFVAVNSAAIADQLMESELFGHVKGSFTGAVGDREGFFVAAQGGTLFLDEIGDMNLDLQAKILRALETREVTPVGGTSSVRVDVRILAATHRDLEDMVRQGTFREDLYYRLRELEIRLPPLRERSEDILDFAERFLAEAAAELGLGGEPRFASDARSKMLEHEWRGNIRELKHAIRTACLRAAGGEVRTEHLELMARSTMDAAPDRPAPQPDGTWKEHLDDQERDALKLTLEQAGGNLTKAAMLFGLPRTTYRERLLKHGLL